VPLKKLVYAPGADELKPYHSRDAESMVRKSMVRLLEVNGTAVPSFTPHAPNATVAIRKAAAVRMNHIASIHENVHTAHRDNEN